MKVVHYIPLFILVLAIGFVMLRVDIKRTGNAQAVVEQININVDNASQDALANVVIADDGSVNIDEDQIINTFYNSMYASFGLLDDPEQQNKFNLYLPVIVLVENDGFYLRYNIVEDNIIKSVWSIKYPFVYTCADYTVNFRLDDTVQFITSYDAYTGKYNKLLDIYNASNTTYYSRFVTDYKSSILYANDSEDYELIKQTAIADNIVKYMQYYIEQNNIIAQNYGISYSFSLPANARSELARTVTDLSLIAVFQGYSNVLNSDQYYSKMSVAGARAYKGTAYYVRQNDSGLKFYHTEDCKVDGTNTESVYYTTESAATTGAFPCPYCNP